MTVPKWVESALSDRERQQLFFPTAPARLLGADEVGRGSWAGPVTVCAFLAPLSWSFEGLNDSKKLGPKRCAIVSERLLNAGGFCHVVRHIPAQLVDSLGVDQALKIAFHQAIGDVLLQIEEKEERPLVVIDGLISVDLPGLRYVSLPKADGKIPHVMAASVLAKTERDAVMTQMDNLVPGYSFSRNKGYGTKQHEDALKKLGMSSVHRARFVPKRALP